MIISIVNHKGGTGKTTTSINLGSSLAEAGYRVVLVDLDAQGSLTYSLGIDDRSPTIADAFHGDATVHQLITEREGMAILPAGAGLADVELAIAKADERFQSSEQSLARSARLRFCVYRLPAIAFIVNTKCAGSLRLYYSAHADGRAGVAWVRFDVGNSTKSQCDPPTIDGTGYRSGHGGYPQEHVSGDFKTHSVQLYRTCVYAGHSYQRKGGRSTFVWQERGSVCTPIYYRH